MSDTASFERGLMVYLQSAGYLESRRARRTGRTVSRVPRPSWGRESGTYESTPSVVAGTTTIGAPSASSGGPTSKTCRIDASAIVSVASAKWRPGHILCGGGARSAWSGHEGTEAGARGEGDAPPSEPKDEVGRVARARVERTVRADEPLRAELVRALVRLRVVHVRPVARCMEKTGHVSDQT